MRFRLLSRALVVAGLASLLSVVAAGGSSAASSTAGACQLQGVANLNPGLSSTSQPFAYSFSGTLTSCQSTGAGAPASGTVPPGLQIPEAVTPTTRCAANDAAAAALTFSPTTQAQDCVTTPVTSANINGVVSIDYSPQPWRDRLTQPVPLFSVRGYKYAVGTGPQSQAGQLSPD